jgi:hypothetical protein
VALETVFRELQVRLQFMDGTLAMLQKTLEDRPPDQGSAVVDDLENIVLDMMGTLHDMRKAGSLARRRVGHPVDLDGARQALTRCQGSFHRIENEFSGGLTAYNKLRELSRLGARGGEWPSWAGRTRQDIEQCQQPLQELSKALVACWQELVEQGGRTSISVTNTGQRIVARKPLDEEKMRAT